MARMEASVVINRPVEEVFAYLMDVNNWPEWTGFGTTVERLNIGNDEALLWVFVAVLGWVGLLAGLVSSRTFPRFISLMVALLLFGLSASMVGLFRLPVLPSPGGRLR